MGTIATIVAAVLVFPWFEWSGCRVLPTVDAGGQQSEEGRTRLYQMLASRLGISGGQAEEVPPASPKFAEAQQHNATDANSTEEAESAESAWWFEGGFWGAGVVWSDYNSAWYG